MQSLTIENKDSKDSKIFHFKVPYSQTTIIKAFEGLMATFKIKNEVKSDDFDIMDYAGIIKTDIANEINIKDLKLKDKNYRQKHGL